MTAQLPTVAYALPMFSLYVYMVLSSVEFGSSIFRIWPKLLRRPDAVAAYLNPVWEATNVFLVYFVICMLTFFPKASGRLGTDLLWVVFPGLAFFGLRIIGMLLIYYGDVRSRVADGLLFAGSFLAPVTLSLTLIYLVAGSWRRFLFSPLYFTLAATVVASIVLIAAAFFRWYADERDNRRLTLLIGCSFVAAAGSFGAFFTFLTRELPHMVETLDRPLWLVGGVALSAAAFVYAEDAQKPLISFLGACGMIATFFFPLAVWHLPYLVYPVYTVESVATDPASFSFMVIASLCGFALIIPAFILLFHLFVFGADAKKRRRRSAR